MYTISQAFRATLFPSVLLKSLTELSVMSWQRLSVKHLSSIHKDFQSNRSIDWPYNQMAWNLRRQDHDMHLGDSKNLIFMTIIE